MHVPPTPASLCAAALQGGPVFNSINENTNDPGWEGHTVVSEVTQLLFQAHA